MSVRDPQSSLVVHFDFEGQGDTAFKDKASGIQGLVKKQSVTITQGKQGNAAHFNGQGVLHYQEDYPVAEYLNLSSDRDFSISTWIKSDAIQTQEQIIMSNKYFYNKNAGWALTTGGTNAAIKVYLGAYNEQTFGKKIIRLNANQATINAATWHHVAFTVNFSTNQALLYFDGNLVDTTSTSGLIGEINQYESAIGDGSGGGNGSSKGFVGAIDEVKIFNKVLSAGEVSALAL